MSITFLAFVFTIKASSFFIVGQAEETTKKVSIFFFVSKFRIWIYLLQNLQAILGNNSNSTSEAKPPCPNCIKCYVCYYGRFELKSDFLSANKLAGAYLVIRFLRGWWQIEGVINQKL